MIEVGYWKIRGLIGGVRVLLEHVGEGEYFKALFSICLKELFCTRQSLEIKVFKIKSPIFLSIEWKETFYEAHLPEGADRNDFSQWDRNEWNNEKKTDKIQSTYAFPNLPWMTDGDVHLTQSTAILKVTQFSTYSVVLFSTILSLVHLSKT